jgi:hypothetical protein
MINIWSATVVAHVASGDWMVQCIFGQDSTARVIHGDVFIGLRWPLIAHAKSSSSRVHRRWHPNALQSKQAT